MIHRGPPRKGSSIVKTALGGGAPILHLAAVPAAQASTEATVPGKPAALIMAIIPQTAMAA